MRQLMETLQGLASSGGACLLRNEIHVQGPSGEIGLLEDVVFKDPKGWGEPVPVMIVSDSLEEESEKEPDPSEPDIGDQYWWEAY